jgi:hypothetical protein
MPWRPSRRRRDFEVKAKASLGSQPLHPIRPNGPTHPFGSQRPGAAVARTRKRSLAEAHLPAKSPAGPAGSKGALACKGVRWDPRHVAAPPPRWGPAAPALMGLGTASQSPPRPRFARARVPQRFMPTLWNRSGKSDRGIAGHRTRPSLIVLRLATAIIRRLIRGLGYRIAAVPASLERPFQAHFDDRSNQPGGNITGCP